MPHHHTPGPLSHPFRRRRTAVHRLIATVVAAYRADESLLDLST